MDTMIRNLAIGMISLIIFVPLGLLAAGTAYGEWEAEELKDKVSYVPSGLGELSGLWHPLMKDYNIPNGPSFQDSKLVASAAYIPSAVIGVIVSGSLLYFIGRKAAKH
jgi:hypothetical protein